jgi:hypothetical protein
LREQRVRVNTFLNMLSHEGIRSRERVTQSGSHARDCLPALLIGVLMPKKWYQRQEPTHEWEQIHPKLISSALLNYEIRCFLMVA